MLVGSEERNAQQILRPYRCPCRERAVFSHQHAPNVRHRQLDEVVLRQIRRFDEDAEIHKPPVQPFRDVIRIAAEQVVRNVGVRRLEPVRRAGNQPHGVGLAASDMDIPADGFFRRAELGFRLFHQRDDLLRPLAEEHAFLRQRNLPFPAQEQRFPQFLLKLHHLPRQRGLGDVQGFRRPGYAFLPCHGKEIAKHPQFHSSSPLITDRRAPFARMSSPNPGDT